MPCKIILDVSSLFWQEKVHIALTKIQKKKSISLFYAHFMAWKNFKFSKENVNIQSVNMSPWCQSKTNSCWDKQCYNLVYPCRRGFKNKMRQGQRGDSLGKGTSHHTWPFKPEIAKTRTKREEKTNRPSCPLTSTHTCPHILTHVYTQTFKTSK